MGPFQSFGSGNKNTIDTINTNVSTVSSLVSGLEQPVRSADSGSLLMDGTEQTIYEAAGPPVFTFLGGHIYMPGIASGAMTLRIYVKIESGGAYIKNYEQTSIGHTTNTLHPVMGTLPSSPYVSIPLPNLYGIKVTVEQTAGTAQTYKFEWFDTLAA